MRSARNYIAAAIAAAAAAENQKGSSDVILTVLYRGYPVDY